MSLLDPARLALAFSVLPWPEQEKARLWESLQNGESIKLHPGTASQLAALDLSRFRDEASAKNARLVLPGDEGSDAFFEPLPYVVALWVRGTLPPPGLRIAVVGTRTPSLVGRERARNWSRQLTESGVNVLSGLARGIDTEAHRAALAVGGRTIAVLGNGLFNIYPPENKALAARICRQGALVSELLPEATVSRHGLLARDRLQAALTQAVIVVQTHTGCGSLTTARYAVSCRRPLFALHWQEEPFTTGLARLRQIGAVSVGFDNLEEIFRAAAEPPRGLFP